MNNKERLALAEWVIKTTLKNGADQATVDISNSRSVEISHRDKKLEKLQESTQNNLSLNVYANQRYSGHSTSDLRKESLEKFIEEAVASTKYLTEDEFRKLPDPKYYPTKLDIDLKLVDGNYDKVESSERVKIAATIEEAAKAVSDKIISATAGYSDSTYESVLVQSNGFAGESSGTYFSAGAEVTVKDDEGGRPEDWYYATTVNFKDLPSIEMLGKMAAKRALQKIGQKKIESGKYTMLVENRAAGNLLSVFRGAMTARALQQKSSWLDGMLGKKVASEKLTVTDDPFIEKSFGSRLFDAEGIAAKKRIMIEKGVLNFFYVDNYYGRKIGMEPTSGGSSNLVFEYGDKNMEEMLKEIKKGILVNGFLGGNSNSTTGDFSFGIVGQLIENGQIVKPINEMNISGNAKEFWNQLVAMGNDPYPYSTTKIPSILFDGVDFSGI
ncbi:MAG: TldD/PmbA family protein [Ignavibacteriales bacterium]|nr:MAG: TldD/PmbA family protein [Ignavibacteriales bacterium]